MSVGEQIEMRLANRFTHTLIMIMLILAMGTLMVALYNVSTAVWVLVIGMVLSWALGAAYGRRQVYRKVGKARQGS